MKKILLASLAVVASASMMAQVSTKLMEFKMDNVELKDAVSGVTIPLAAGTPTIVEGPVAGSSAIHFDGATWYNLTDCTQLPGTQLGTKEFTFAVWFRFPAPTGIPTDADPEAATVDALQGCFFEVGSTSEYKFFQMELQGSTPPAKNLEFFTRYNSSKKIEPVNTLSSTLFGGRHFIQDGNWHLMVGVRKTDAEVPNWYIIVDGVVSDDIEADAYALTQDMKEPDYEGGDDVSSWFDISTLSYVEKRLPFQSTQLKQDTGVTTVEYNMIGNFSVGANVKDGEGSSNYKQLIGDIHSIVAYEGAATTDEIRAWYNEVYPGFYTIEAGSTGGIQDVTVAEADADAPAYNLFGQPVDDTYQGIIIKGGKKYLQK